MLAFFMYIIYRYFKVQRWTREERPARIAPWENNANIIDDRQKQKTKSSKHNICPIISNNNSLLKQFLKRKGTRLLRFDGEIKRKVSPSVELVAWWKKKRNSRKITSSLRHEELTFDYLSISTIVDLTWIIYQHEYNNNNNNNNNTLFRLQNKMMDVSIRQSNNTTSERKAISFSFHATTNNTLQSTG